MKTLPESSPLLDSPPVAFFPPDFPPVTPANFFKAFIPNAPAAKDPNPLGVSAFVNPNIFLTKPSAFVKKPIATNA